MLSTKMVIKLNQHHDSFCPHRNIIVFKIPLWVLLVAEEEVHLCSCETKQNILAG